MLDRNNCSGHCPQIVFMGSFWRRHQAQPVLDTLPSASHEPAQRRWQLPLDEDSVTSRRPRLQGMQDMEFMADILS